MNIHIWSSISGSRVPPPGRGKGSKVVVKVMSWARLPTLGKVVLGKKIGGTALESGRFLASVNYAPSIYVLAGIV